jgi:hypothetical protein
MNAPRTWLLTAREVSSSVAIRDEPAVWMGMVLDSSSQAICGAEMTTSDARAVDDALAVARERDDHEPSVIALDATMSPDLAKHVRAVLDRSACNARVDVADLPDWAEDVVVDVIDHLSGRGGEPARSSRPSAMGRAPS